MFRAVRAGLALSLAIGLAGSVCADTVTTRDGRRFVGEVTKTDTGYTVKTKLGEVHISAGDFDKWSKDDAGATVASVPIAPRTGPPTPGVAGGGSIPGAPAAGGKKADPKSLEALVKQGRAALAAGEYKAAREAFHDVAAIDPRNVEALHGAGVAAMYLNDFPHALPPMEKAMTANPSPNRALVLNMAVCQNRRYV